MSNNLIEPNSPVRKVWKSELYKIQLDAPTPKPILRRHDLSNAPSYFGYEYHGLMNHSVSESLLQDMPDGFYLVRQSPGATDFHTLSMKFGTKIKHYKVYYKPDTGHFLKEDLKRFETIHDLVADGLINLYMQVHAAPILQEMMSQTRNNYKQSPYMTLNRRKLLALSGDLKKSLKDHSLQQNNSATAHEHHAECDNLKIGDHSSSGNIAIAQEEAEILPVIYEKSHHFKVHTFKGLNWCEFCANFLWGFTAQGVKCDDCGFIAHNKCSELVPAKCVPDLKRIRGVFGADLTTMVAAHQSSIPFVIKRCIEEVEARGMLQEGIYRVSGFADEIDTLKMALDRDGEKADISETAYSNVNVIAGTLKLYLRLLPVPLITFQTYNAFINSTKYKSNEQITAIRGATKQLPPAHYNCLKCIIEHLHKVASYQLINKMTEHNLATVFAPTLIAIPPYLTDLSREILMLSSLITNCHEVFSTKE